MGDLRHEHLTGEIIGAAMEVLNELKPGLDEKLYENAQVIELQEKGLGVNQQGRHDVFYKEKYIGTLIPDLVVSEAVIVDPKVVKAFTESHIAQMIGYLVKTGLDVALLINFKYAKLQWKRVLNPNLIQ